MTDSIANLGVATPKAAAPMQAGKLGNCIFSPFPTAQLQIIRTIRLIPQVYSTHSYKSYTALALDAFSLFD